MLIPLEDDGLDGEFIILQHCFPRLQSGPWTGLMNVMPSSESQERDFLAEYEVLERYGIDRLGLGEWKACLYFDRHELPSTRSIYLLMDECVQRSLEDDLLYIGIAPQSLWSRWVTPATRGGSQHHVLERLFRWDPVEWVEADENDLYIAYCELPEMPLTELERVEECMIDLLIPRLNRQKTPLHPYKTAFRELRKAAVTHGWPTGEWNWPSRALQFHEYMQGHLWAFQSAQLEQAPQWMSGLRGRWNYRAVVPGFDFLPCDWRLNMRYCPTHIIRKHVLQKISSL